MNYNRIYNQLVDKRKMDPYLCGYSENHHIIPRCAGGTDDKDNLVRLSAREHYIAHLLLTKIYKNTEFHSKLIFAWHMMANMKLSSKCDRNYKINSYLYAKLKEEHAKAVAEANSIHQAGSGNSQYGTKWIHNLELRESRKISNDYEIPVGWAVGRVISWDFLDRKCTNCDTNLQLKTRANTKICKICNSCKNKSIKQTTEEKYVKLWEEFILSDYNSISEFSRYKNISVPIITKMWKKHINTFSKNVEHGKSLSSSIARNWNCIISQI